MLPPSRNPGCGAIYAPIASGIGFKRQQPIGHFIVDFVCFANGLVIEVDGSQHGDQRHYDVQRTAWLNQRGSRVLRFWNNAVLADTDFVLDAIWHALQSVEPRAVHRKE